MLISIVTPTFNEVGNVDGLVKSIAKVMNSIGCSYEHIIIDNCSTDGTIDRLRHIVKKEKNVKVILNARNFGQIRSPYHATLASSGDVCINLPSDGEVPVEIIVDLLEKWKQGYKVVHAVKTHQKFSVLGLVKIYYQKILKMFSQVDVVVNFSGYGLVDSSIIQTFRRLQTVYPFYRGLVGEFLNDYAVVNYSHNQRKTGKSSNNYWSLFEYAIIGLITYTKLPFQISIFAAFVCFGLGTSLVVFELMGLVFGYQATTDWTTYLFGVFFYLASVSFLVLAMLSEYIYQIFLNTRNTPLVVERERLNFASENS
jgi:glycosyltransferase involved in cell wall biosynthesis